LEGEFLLIPYLQGIRLLLLEHRNRGINGER